MTFAELDKIRKAARNKIIAILIIALLVLSPMIFSLRLPFQSHADNITQIVIGILYPCFFIVLVVFIIMIFVRKKIESAYREAYKAYFVSPAIFKIFSNCHYEPNQGIDYGTLMSTGMIKEGNIFNSNDFMIGNYNGIIFSQSDVELKKRIEVHTKNGTVTKEQKIFKGRYMMFTFKKNFDYRLEIVGKNFYASSVPIGRNGKKLERISLESITFNKKMKTYAEDGFEAFYLLEPAFLSNIEALSDKYHNEILLGFYNDTLHIAIQDEKDSLEPSSCFKKIEEAQEFQKVTKELQLVTNVIDSLKLK